MKKLFYIFIFLSLFGKSHTPLINDVSLHYMAGVNIASFSCASATLFQYTFCKEIKLSVSLGIGFSNAFTASNTKEDIYDGEMKLGTRSNPDRGMTYWGGAVGTLTYIPFHNYYTKRKIDCLKYQFK